MAEPHAVAAYERLGEGYARVRRPDPRIAAAIQDALGDAKRILNVGAGTGSYEPVDRTVVAVELSPVMIRQRPIGSAPCVCADAQRLPFPDGEFDVAMAVLTLHHWPDQERGLQELARAGRGVVVLTFEPEIHNSFWLFRDYVPAIAQLPSSSDVLAVERVAEILGADRVEPVLIPHDCQDGFGCAYWRRPGAYLDPEVRRGISGFGLVERDEAERGLERLARDLASGEWQRRYGDLPDEATFDGGLRLVVRDPR